MSVFKFFIIFLMRLFGWPNSYSGVCLSVRNTGESGRRRTGEREGGQGRSREGGGGRWQ
jgi:hypothetical protein